VKSSKTSSKFTHSSNQSTIVTASSTSSTLSATHTSAQPSASEHSTFTQLPPSTGYSVTSQSSERTITPTSIRVSSSVLTKTVTSSVTATSCSTTAANPTVTPPYGYKPVDRCPHPLPKSWLDIQTVNASSNEPDINQVMRSLSDMRRDVLKPVQS
jgi:hypothetical protein